MLRFWRTTPKLDPGLEFAFEQDPVLIIGAGVSIPDPAGLPDWRTFSVNLGEAIIRAGGVDPDDTAGWRRELNTAAPEVVLQALELKYEDYKVLLAPFRRGAPNSYHASIARLCRVGLVRRIVTTNFDTFIEDALRAKGVKHVVLSSPRDFAAWRNKADSTVTVAKIHGCARRPETILSKKHHLQVGLGPEKRRFLIDVMSGSTIAVIGSSGADLEKAGDHLALQYASDTIKAVYWNLHGGGPEYQLPSGLRNLQDTLGDRLHLSYSGLATELLLRGGQKVKSLTTKASRDATLAIRTAVQSWVNRLKGDDKLRLCRNLMAALNDPKTALALGERLTDDEHEEADKATWAKDMLSYANCLAKAGDMVAAGIAAGRVHKHLQQGHVDWVTATQASFLMADSLFAMGVPDKAALILSDCERLVQEKSLGPELMLSIRNKHAVILLAMKHLERAITLNRSAIEEAQQIGQHDAVPTFLLNLGICLRSTGQTQEARAAYNSAQAEARKWGDGRTLAIAQVRLATLAVQEALPLNSEAVRILLPAFQEAARAISQYRSDPAFVENLSMLALLLSMEGQMNEAEQCADEALEASRGLAGLISIWAPQAAIVYGKIGNINKQQQALEKGIYALKSRNDPGVHVLYRSLGKLLAQHEPLKGDADLALTRALAWMRQTQYDQHIHSEAQECRRLIRNLRKLAIDPACLSTCAAMTGVVCAFDAERTSFDEDVYEVIRSGEPRIRQLWASDQNDMALRCAESLLSLSETYGDDCLTTAAMNVVGQALGRVGRDEEALFWFERAIPIAERAEDSVQVLFCAYNAADTLASLGRKDQLNELQYLRRAIELLEKSAECADRVQEEKQQQHIALRLNTLSLRYNRLMRAVSGDANAS